MTGLAISIAASAYFWWQVAYIEINPTTRLPNDAAIFIAFLSLAAGFIGLQIDYPTKTIQRAEWRQIVYDESYTTPSPFFTGLGCSSLFIWMPIFGWLVYRIGYAVGSIVW